jgi:hypothetical protein
MAKRSILSAVREEQAAPAEPAAPPPPELAPQPISKVKPSRRVKKHIGGYYSANDPVIIAFQKLGIDLDTNQQDMLFEAIRDFVAKHQAASAFHKEPFTRPGP